jgi:mediator of RNA polymerase II transcription subunit 17
MDKDGSIVLDPALALKPRTLRVRISDNGKVTGTSRLSMDGETSKAAIETTIQRARNSLFEEELYHEMSLETRQLLAYGVEYRDSVITVNASATSSQQSTMKLLIDCIPLDDRSATSQDHTNDELARNVAEGLRLLLVHEHSMRLHRRSQLPPPLTGQKREKPSPPLLRTLLSIFRHLESVDSLYSYLATATKTLESAGLHVQTETTREVSWAKLVDSLQTAPRKGLTATDQLLDIFSKPYEGKATLSLPTSNSAQPEVLTISTRTVIGQPTFGTEHKLTLPSTLAASLELFQQQKLSTTEELTSYLDWVVSLHIAHRQLMNEFSARAVIKGNDARITIRSKDAKKATTVDKDISVQFQDGKLHVVAMAPDAEEATEGTDQSCVWTGREDEMSLTERVKSWVG